MIVNPDIDLTPETAEALLRFTNIFGSGRFVLMSTLGGEALGSTDLATLYRVMDVLLLTASGCQLCGTPEYLSPQQKLERAKQNAAEIKEALAQLQEQFWTWYEDQSPETQAAIQALMVATVAWIASLKSHLSSEAQTLLEAIRTVLLTLLGESSTRTGQTRNLLRIAP